MIVDLINEMTTRLEIRAIYPMFCGYSRQNEDSFLYKQNGKAR